MSFLGDFFPFFFFYQGYMDVLERSNKGAFFGIITWDLDHSFQTDLYESLSVDSDVTLSLTADRYHRLNQNAIKGSGPVGTLRDTINDLNSISAEWIDPSRHETGILSPKSHQKPLEFGPTNISVATEPDIPRDDVFASDLPISKRFLRRFKHGHIRPN
jgi:hypothetical protein